MLESARAVGADIPTYYGPATAETAASQLSFPVVVKPLANWRFESQFGSKLFVARDREELRRCVARLADAKIDGQVVDLVPGPDTWDPPVHDVHRRARRTAGRPHGEKASSGSTSLRQRTSRRGRRRRGRTGGDHRRARSANGSPRHCERGVQTGLTRWELSLHRAQRPLGHLQQPAPTCRPRSGVAGVLRLRLERPERARPNGWAGVWINLHADVLYSTVQHHLDGPSLKEFLAPYRRRKLEAVWSARDPRPFVTLWSRTARSAALALVNRRVENEGHIGRRCDGAEILDDPSRERNA